MGMTFVLSVGLLYAVWMLASKVQRRTFTADAVSVEAPYRQLLKNGFLLRNHNFETKAVGTVLSCGHLCMNTPGCESVNFSKQRGSCELNDIASSDLDADDGYSYMEIGANYELANELGSCVNGCLNNSTCTVISTCADESERLPYQYKCDCADGFRGLRCEKAISYTNVAVGKPTLQSSTMYGGIPEMAVDGNTTDYFVRTLDALASCTHTRKKLNSWWKVDLLKSYWIRKINVTNRGDCCGDRILTSEVRVGLSSTIENNEVCGETIMVIDPNVTSQILFDCDIFARFVSVQRTDSEKIPLTLCEIQVYADEPDWEVVFLGVGRSNVDLYQLWLDGTAVGDKSEVGVNSTENYVNDVINRWVDLYIQYVKLSIFKDGVEVATIAFDGSGSNKTDWLTSSRILSSSWLDLKDDTGAIMSGDHSAGDGQGFSATEADANSCASWSGWILVTGATTPGCGWLPASASTSSVIMYSTEETASSWSSSDKDEGDLMMISVYYQY
ncbi:uncharacterized protein [Ptychodera flava]|uniref:uncharacterized protein n=1 Tax=Ptychodera flava TaxID=63121 RepID=UPI00396A3DF8